MTTTDAYPHEHRWTVALVVATIASCISIAALAAAIALRINTTSQINKVALKNCQNIEVLKSYTEGAVQRALKTLPDTAYYREHPEELAAEMRQLEQTANEFKPVKCVG